MNQSITNISVEVLKVHPRNTEFFDDISGEEYERFKKSIDEDGLLSPLVVSPDMTVISGHQRLKACKELGHRTVPVIINENLEDEDEKLKKLIAANFGRLKNDPIKQGKLLDEYMRLSGVRRGSAYKKAEGNNSPQVKREDIAKELGVDVTTLNNLKRLTTLIPEFQDIISDGKITATTGYKVLAKLSDEEQQKLLEQLPASQKLTQKQIEWYVSQIQEKDNIIAGYKIKLESKPEQPADIEQLLDEKEELETEKRKWYEKAQSYKKEADEFQRELERTKSEQPKVPDDYETLKRLVDSLRSENQDLSRKETDARRQLKEAKFISKNKLDSPPEGIAQEYNYTYFEKATRDFQRLVNPFEFMDEILKGIAQDEKSNYISLIIETQESLTKIYKIMEEV